MNAFAKLGLILILGGCATWPFQNHRIQTIDNPVEALREVSVLPVGADSRATSRKWTEQLHGALLKVKGVDRVRVLPITAVEDERGVRAGVDELAAETQCLLELNILSFDAYFPPSARIEVNFYLPHRSTTSTWDPLTLERRGTASGSTTTSGDRDPWIRFQRLYSANDVAVMQKLERYAKSLPDHERGFEPADNILRVSDRYIDFVLHETIRECFSRIDTKEKENDGLLSKLLNAGSR